MELHNTNEDVVIAQVNDMFNMFEQSDNIENICTCEQCRIDTACYVLNRIEPRYIVSNRGAVRIEQNSIENQQRGADIVVMIREGITQINHNKRPSSTHEIKKEESPVPATPVFNLPAISGRVFDGANFAPMADIDVELLRSGEMVAMVDNNWQNPFHLIEQSKGTFSFWPAPVLAKEASMHAMFEFSVRINAQGFDDLDYFFKIPVKSEQRSVTTFLLSRSFKLPDLYLFPPGEEDLFS
ncbi:MAG: late competence development ComFB family protein [Treponema sp.]|jgi:competence protein ComFB|nr:late competence development ComFB family protein [Treponema sp.]